MAIQRTALIDDDGTGTTGTVWNNAKQTELYNQIDAALLAFPALTEGVWTPGLSFLTGAVGITYSSQVGYYVKIGRAVFVQGRVALSSKGTSTGQLDLTNLPFTAAGTTNLYGGLTVSFRDGLTGVTGGITAYISPLTTKARVVWHPVNVISADLLDTNCTATTTLVFYGLYFAQ